MNTPVPLQPLIPRPASRGAMPPSMAAAPAVGRSFADDGSLWESVRERGRALCEDLRQPEQRAPLLVVAVLAMLLTFSYWPGLLDAKATWLNNPQYSHGWLVPLFSVVMLFWWRQPVAPTIPSARVAGLSLLVASLAIRLVMARYRIITIDMYTFVPALAGAVLLAGGWSMFRWAWAPVAFLIFMYPLPDEATRYLLGPMQTVATTVSTFAIQTLGIDAVQEGNRIIIGEKHLGVVDACSGLRMLTIFVALSVAIVMVGRLDLQESLVILATAVPIALTVNAIRITVTAVMYSFSPDLAEKIFHDWAGYFMMPLALAMLYGVRMLLAGLLVAEETLPAAVVPVDALGGMGAFQRTGLGRQGGVPRGDAAAAGRAEGQKKPKVTPETAAGISG